MVGKDPRAVREAEFMKLMGAPIEERFDKLTRLAKKMFGVPVSMIDFMSSSRHEDVFVVPDTNADAFENPFSADLRFFASAPLKSEGVPIGRFCICDYEPRNLSEEEIHLLVDLAELAERELTVAVENEKLTQRALVDVLTRIWNRGAVLDILTRELQTARETKTQVGLLLLDVDHFKLVNDEFGHAAGDQVLQRIAETMRGAIRPGDTVGRYGGEEFLVVLPGCQHDVLLKVAERLREAVACEPIMFDGFAIPVTISIGATMAVEGASEHMLMKAVDLGLYRAKQSGRNRVETRWVTPSLVNIKSMKP